MVTSKFPGLGRYAAMGSILAARQNALAGQNPAGPTYMNPQVNGPDVAQSPQQDMAVAPMTAGQAPEVPQDPTKIGTPPAPVSSMIRDAAPQRSMAGQAQQANQRYRGMA